MNTLYRFFGADGALLYVGRTCSPPRRLREHMSEKQWWSDVARIEMEQFSSRQDLVTAEKKAIADERPKHNIVGNGGKAPTARAADAHEVSSLIGLYFHTDDEGDQWQGMVTGEVEGGFMLVKLYDWLVGSPAPGLEMVAVEEMRNWTFYDDPENWTFDYDQRIEPRRRYKRNEMLEDVRAVG